MAQQTTTVAVGIREDLADRIWDRSPVDTPFVSSIARVRAEATKHEFQTNRLRTPQHKPSTEGASASTPKNQVTTRLDNYTQIIEDTADVSGTMEAVTTAGRDSEMAYQIACIMEEIKTFIEASCHGRAPASAGKVAGATREMGAVQAYTGTNFVSQNGDGTPPAGSPFPDGSAGYTPGAGTTALDETTGLKAMLQLAYNNGSKMNCLLASSANKGIISNFNGGTTVYNTADDRKLVAGIDVYEGDFHSLEIKPSRIIHGADVYGYDPEYMELAELRPMYDKELGDVGDSWRRQVIWEGCVAVRNEQAHGIIVDTTG